MKHKPKAKRQPKRDINQIAFSVVQAVIDKSEGKGELGLSLKPSPDLPLSFDLGVSGYTGKREGVTGSLQIKFEF